MLAFMPVVASILRQRRLGNEATPSPQPCGQWLGAFSSPSGVVGFECDGGDALERTLLKGESRGNHEAWPTERDECSAWCEAGHSKDARDGWCCAFFIEVEMGGVRGRTFCTWSNGAPRRRIVSKIQNGTSAYILCPPAPAMAAGENTTGTAGQPASAPTHARHRGQTRGSGSGGHSSLSRQRHGRRR